MNDQSRKLEMFKFCYRYFDFKSVVSRDEKERSKFENLKRKIEAFTHISFNSSFVFNLLQNRRYREVIDYVRGFLVSSPEKYFTHIDVRRFFVSLVLCFYEECERNLKGERTKDVGNYIFGLYMFLFKYCAQEMNDSGLWRKLNLAMGGNNDPLSSPFDNPNQSPIFQVPQNHQSQAMKNLKILEAFFLARVHFPPETPEISRVGFLEEISRRNSKKSMNDEENFFDSPIFKTAKLFFQREEESSRSRNEELRRAEYEIKRLKQQQQQQNQNQNQVATERRTSISEKKKNNIEFVPRPPPKTSISSSRASISSTRNNRPRQQQQQQRSSSYTSSTTSRKSTSRTSITSGRRRRRRKSSDYIVSQRTPPPPPSSRWKDEEKQQGTHVVLNVRITCRRDSTEIWVPKDTIENYTSYSSKVVCVYFYKGDCVEGNRCRFCHISRRNIDKYWRR